MDKMKRMRKSIIWMAAFMFCSGAVLAQKAERKNVRELAGASADGSKRER